MARVHHLSAGRAEVLVDRPPPRPPRSSLTRAQSAVLDLQQSAGNRATSQAFAAPEAITVSRAPLTAAEKAQDLSSARYAGQPALEAAYDDSPMLSQGARGTGVAAVQQGLVDAGFPMPVSTSSGKPDGVFGSETAATVRAFQSRNGLVPDGLVGRKTMGRLDELAGGKAAGQPEIVNDEASLGKHVADEMTRVNQDASFGPDKGVWYDYNYFAEHQKDPATYPWNDDWRSGLASPAHFDRTGWMDWKLKPGQSASAAIQAWLHGLTIAECLTAIVAIEIDTVRAAVGDTEFDRRYGQAGGGAAEGALRVHAGTEGTPVAGSLTSNAVSGAFGKRDLKLGDWVYFYNHPRYLLKHPGGAWQGENAVYTGDDAAGQQLFTGLGAAGKTEAGMLTEMVGAYGGARDGADYVALLDTYAADKPEVVAPTRQYLDHDDAYTQGLYQKYLSSIPAKYREDGGEFPDTCTSQDILDAPPYELNGTTRTGGFTGTANRLDPAKVKP
ncbi:peptidoglycan-binding protein [uncultured Friedmanniella sp.]|uniref:peptidoglycan-binding domain-containing protein n=1 Tax=uncultured Friedmanniella sp. TaxID=335381 RepID=UPI0035C94F38